jgi:hypothetical protein
MIRGEGGICAFEIQGRILGNARFDFVYTGDIVCLYARFAWGLVTSRDGSIWGQLANGEGADLGAGHLYGGPTLGLVTRD